MKKSKLFMISGAVIMATCAIFATKANKKYNAKLSTAANSLGWKLQAVGRAKIFTVVGSANYVVPYMCLYTLTNNTFIGGSSLLPEQLYTASASIQTIYLNRTLF